MSTAGAARRHAPVGATLRRTDRADSRAPAWSPTGPAAVLEQLQQVGGNAMTVRLVRSLATGPGAPADELAGRISGRVGGGERLAPDLQRRYGDVVGPDALAGVRVHRDAESADLARSLGARAFTVGADVFFGQGEYQPGTRGGSHLLAHELVHTVQAPAAPAATGLTVSDPADAHEVAAERAAAQWVAGSSPADAPVGRSAGIARQPTGAHVPDPSERYGALLLPSLDEADRVRLDQATGGAHLVDMITRRDRARTELAALADDAQDRSGVDPAATSARQALAAVEADLSAQIGAELAALDVPDERTLLQLVHQWFPARFLAEAKTVAVEMLQHNADEARSELERYSALVCSPDIDGLLAADRMLAELAPQPLALSIQVAESALSRYAPAAGVLTPEEFARRIPENEQSVMVDIANLDRNRQLLAQRVPIYNAARYSFGRTYPILLSSAYVPGSFSSADPTELGAMVGGTVTEVLANIERVRDAIDDDDLKVWNMRDVLRITQERLGVTHETLIAAIRTRIEAIEDDETFLGWVVAALAITTTLLAGMLFTPAAGVAVAAAWGAGALYGSINSYLDESAAEHVALDEAVADLSLNEPSLTWVLLDAAFLLVDLAPVARALRPAARTLAANGDAVALSAFRSRATAALGEDVGEQLTARAASRFGIGAAGLQVAEARLVRARAVLAGLDLPDDAIARVLAKGADVNQVKGQLFEEIMHVDVARRMATGADDVLGVADSAGLEVIEGHRIADLAGRQLTDGVIARRLPDGTMELVTVLEAKAGRGAAQGLRSSSSGIGDPEEFARFVIEQNRPAVLAVLRRSGLTDDVRAVVGGSEELSAAAIEAVAADKGMRRLVTQAELGGQVRKDVERLAPGTSSLDDVASELDEVPTQILVDGVPTTVRMSPTRTRFVGVVPQDVPTDAITTALTGPGQRFNFTALQLGGRAADITDRAQRLIADQAAAAATVPVP
ncbi:DUF4157 domain-containing protein [Cellulomonas sp. S1-8]|uniref:eCIS core domain-containing protein n=1 Tax=Cellulomonas sp. S1-8 TaxID=2904790 RepID=UPI002242F57E|nr:DUF4157 domain-containing protein [Cellulomonas sp. S1-8]UZN02887.1 DUF4157 domain-containing protein [Cellulomonas sp. S1-8]